MGQRDRVQQVESNRRQLLAEGGFAEVEALCGVLGILRSGPSLSLALRMQQVMRARVPFRLERFDITGGRREMLRRPTEMIWAGGDCDDQVAFAGIWWEVLTGKAPHGSLYVPSVNEARHVALVASADPWVTVDAAPGAPVQWEPDDGEVIPW